MIEVVSSQLCTGCNICVRICPTNVFDPAPKGVKGGLPKLARAEQCQTCFMCELYCPEDALYVAPEVDVRSGIDESSVVEAGLLGSYRSAIGWKEPGEGYRSVDATYRLVKIF